MFDTVYCFDNCWVGDGSDLGCVMCTPFDEICKLDLIFVCLFGFFWSLCDFMTVEMVTKN